MLEALAVCNHCSAVKIVAAGWPCRWRAHEQVSVHQPCKHGAHVGAALIMQCSAHTSCSC